MGSEKVQSDHRSMFLGVSALDREYIWQRLYVAQRFFCTGKGVLDTIDNLHSNSARPGLWKTRLCNHPDPPGD